MTAMNRQTGRAMDPNSDAHLVQSIGDILTTPKGSRVMRRDYGSELPNLVDLPNTPLNRMRAFAATALALQRWEPRVRLKRVQLAGGADGVAALRLDVVRTDLPPRPATTLTIPLAV
ncbi:MAG: GPW/gp25 family protein [Brevundimonas sp.]|uniref:GPW/gp25 family protein n=1 Tax=Brevundimonas sp. TaxID=1871086 RepID=UPI003918C6E2